MQIPLIRKLAKPALTYGPAFLCPAVWAFAKYPQEMGWVADAYGRTFGIISSLYEDWTKVEGYGEPLERALDEVRQPPSRILDVATGTGFVARKLKKMFPSAEVTGVDITSQMISIAQHQAVAEGLDIDFKVADSAELPFEDATFDLVVLQNSIPYAEELMRVTAAGGRVLVIFSFGGPWVSLAWPALGENFQAAGAEYIWSSTEGSGFYGVARRSK
ncbi:MAG: class I SAM-dependent methyltransferase [Actinomycetota bacterium]|nr:class I SAM-dependent methyltransferase [Actinomycetota bacterium]